MTLQQLKYVLKIVETGSISAAAKELYISQPSLSKAVMELEGELGTTLFIREKTGIRLTDGGNRFVVRAKQVIEQMNLLERSFIENDDNKTKFSVSTHHYNFVVAAFAELVRDFNEDSYEFYIREIPTSNIIEDVKTGKSELGIIYLSEYNNEVIRKKLQNEGLEFETLFRERLHVCMDENNPLAEKAMINIDELSELPRLNYEQQIDDSYFFYEDPYSECSVSKDINVTDKATMIHLMKELNGYNISTSVVGKRSKGNGVVVVPLESNEYMDIGYIHLIGRPFSDLAHRFISLVVEKRKQFKEI